MIGAASARFSHLRRLPRLGVAFMAGVVSTFALPPYHAIPVLWIALPVLRRCGRGGRQGRVAFGKNGRV